MGKAKRNWKKRSHHFYVEKQKRRADKMLRRRQRRHSFSIIRTNISVPRNQLTREQILRRDFPGYRHVKAPREFSLVDNEIKTLEFLQELKVCLDSRQKTLVRLDDVKILSTDAILVLLSNMVHFQVENVGFNGTKPTDQRARQKLELSGFIKHLYGTTGYELEDQYAFRKMSSHLYTHGQKTVASKEADELVKYASETVWGEARRCPGVQKTLLELMHNTHDHAGESKGERLWWLSVEHNKQEKEVTFSFIDFGVGIFRSLENKGPNEPLYGAMGYIKQLFPWVKTQAQTLQLILEEKVHLTQTNEYYRGKGLAKIYSLYRQNMISSLSIISNNASFNAEKNDYHVVSKEFMGTFVSFKIDEHTKSLPWQI